VGKKIPSPTGAQGSYWTEEKTSPTKEPTKRCSQMVIKLAGSPHEPPGSDEMLEVTLESDCKKKKKATGTVTVLREKKGKKIGRAGGEGVFSEGVY